MPKKPFRRRYSAPAGSFFGQRSHCPWIESAGFEDTPPLDSFQGEQTADVVIVGGGYTGLSTALHLAERFPERRIILLEGARVGYGASGRNDGLVLPFINGAEAIVHEFLDAGRVDEARRVYEATSAGIGLIADLAEKRGVDCEWERVDCLFGAVTPGQEKRLMAEREMYAALGREAMWLPESELRQQIDISGYRGALTIPGTGMINPAKLARGLLALVREVNVEIYEGSPVVEIETGSTISVRTPSGTVRAAALVLATNAYTHHLGFLRSRVLPVHSYNIATAPLTETQIAEVFWTGRQPFYDAQTFFNLVRLTAENRLILSGGDFFYNWGGAAVDDARHRDFGRLEALLGKLFPALEGVAVTHRWVGHVGFSLDRMPTVGAFGPEGNVYFAGGYAGHGVTVSILCGRLLRDLYSGESLDPVYNFFLKRTPSLTPVEPLRSLGFELGKRYMRWTDSR